MLRKMEAQSRRNTRTGHLESSRYVKRKKTGKPSFETDNLVSVAENLNSGLTRETDSGRAIASEVVSMKPGTASRRMVSQQHSVGPAELIEKIRDSRTSSARLAHGCTSLMYACQRGDVDEVLEQLRSKPESVNQRDSRNKNALHYCAVQDVAKREVVAAASIAIAVPELLESADEDGFTPLHLAVIQGNLAMVNLLLSNKADVNAVDKEGHSVVHWATVCGEVEALRSVLTAGANISIPDINGGSPLHYAAQMCGANYEGKLGQAHSSRLALDILNVLLGHPQSSVDIQDKDGRQPLLWAASAGSAKAVIALVKVGARVESADKDGLTALHCAASRGHTECIDTLISLCGAPTDLIDSNGCTALHYAVTLGHADSTSRLLDLEADPNRQDRKGRTPAHCGCSKGQLETVKLLKERGANLWLRNAKGDLPVHEAVCSGRRELVEWLLEQRTNQVNTTSNDGRSLLHSAAANNFTDLCKILLEYGGDINAVYRNSKGIVITPLDCALQRGHRSTAKFLQSHGGLPASKLRLAARRASPFHDNATDSVRPLKYAEKEELHDLRTSKKYVVYSKRSDSDEVGEDNCSCSGQSHRREHKYGHTCRRHQRARKEKLRRRTSSCGEQKGKCHSDKCEGMCRSKSNIELRRRKSRECNLSSSDWEEGDDGDGDDDEDSCENCCYHKKQKQRIVHKKKTRPPTRGQKVPKDGDDNAEQSSKQMYEKNDPIEAYRTRPASSGGLKTQEAQGIQKSKESTFIKSSSSTHSQRIDKSRGNGNGDETSNEAQKGSMVTTQVDVHHNAEDNSDPQQKLTQLEDAAASASSEAQEKELEEKISRAIDQVFEVVTTAEPPPSPEPETIQSDLVLPEARDENLIEASSENINSSIQESQNASIPDQLPPEPIAKPQSIESMATPSPSSAAPAAGKGENVAAAPVAERSTEKATTPELPKATDELSVPEVPPSPIDLEKAKHADKDLQGFTGVENKIQRQESESRRSFTLLPSDSAEDEGDAQVNDPTRKSSFQVLKSDESGAEVDRPSEEVELSDTQDFFEEQHDPQPVAGVSEVKRGSKEGYDLADGSKTKNESNEEAARSPGRRFKGSGNRQGIGVADSPVLATGSVTAIYDYGNGARKRRLKKRVKSGAKTRNTWKNANEVRDDVAVANTSKDQDSGFEPSPRTTKTKIPTPRNIYTAHVPRKLIYTTVDGRSCSSRLEHRKPGDRGACDMSAVTRSIQRNIRRYYMERKIFQHLLELKSLQIRSNKLNEAVLVKRAVDDYHKSCISLGGETGTRLRRYSFTEYTFKNFELFLYETLKALQKPGTYNFQNINEVYEEAERRLSPDYNAYEKALQCTTKTHRCLHAAHAYTGIPCAAYIPMMNHHTMPKFGFGPYKKTGVGSFYLPKILSTGSGCGGKVALELSSHGRNKQLISLPSEKLDSNKRYYVTFTVKETGRGGSLDAAAGDFNNPAPEHMSPPLNEGKSSPGK